MRRFPSVKGKRVFESFLYRKDYRLKSLFSVKISCFFCRITSELENANRGVDSSLKIEKMLKKFCTLSLILSSLTFCSVPTEKQEVPSNAMFLLLAGTTSVWEISKVACDFISDSESDQPNYYLTILLSKNGEMKDVHCVGDTIQKIDSFKIDPPLPAGIEAKIDGGKIVLTGSPTTVVSDSDYRIELIGPNKTEKGRFFMSVQESGSSSSVYFLNRTVEIAKGVQESIQILSMGEGQIVEASFEPALPTGLTYNPVSGILSGITNDSLGFSSHRISAQITDENGTRPDIANDTYLFIIIVANRITYANNTYYFPTNANISIVPETRSASIATYVINNGVTLPSGLSFQTTTGIISGMTSTEEKKSNLEIKGTNAFGDFKTYISALEVLPREKMTCNTSGIAAGCTKGSPYSCSATTRCYSSHSTCKKGLLYASPCQF